MMTAYKTTSLLRTGIELGVFDVLAERPLRPEEVAERLGLDARATRITLDALAALGLLESEDGRLGLSPGADELLVRESPGYFGDMVHVISSDEEWEALRRLPEAVRNGGSVLDTDAESPEYRYWEDFASYAAAIAEPTAQVVTDTLEPWAKERDDLDVLDVACGHGIYGFTFAERHPRARLWALDWPNVLTVTAEHAEAFGLDDRTEYIEGDMFEAPLGGPYDLITITNVLHHFSEERATELLRRAAGVLKPGGRIGIVGFTLDDGRPPRQDPAPHLFSVLMLVWTSQGEVHPMSAYKRMLSAAGLELEIPAVVPGLPFRVLTARHA
uniref:class I SAM-dependent methyltransferase n=1 Tax=Nocardiopsis halophila TaxID=141692 RepID=UPI00035C1175|nr:class I SAM-dependent methyltransferase [Nocardiopsis halophila]